MIRWVSTIVPSTEGGEGKVVCRVGVPKGLVSGAEVLSMGGAVREKQREVAGCAVAGCSNGRKYRSTRKFEVGGCSLEHLRLVNHSLAMAN